ncbi:MAG: dihydroorotate dehydrogenase, partial [Gammaproteobacteria bacterium]|nr:dihydroorotate dehydrogenase [Gammaproteobacteria bacterium]
LEFLIAGATAIGIGTALFYEPLVCKDMITGMNRFLKDNGLSHISELTGTLKLHD